MVFDVELVHFHAKLAYGTSCLHREQTHLSNCQCIETRCRHSLVYSIQVTVIFFDSVGSQSFNFMGRVDYYRVLYVDARKVNKLCLGFTPVSADVLPSGH